MGIISTISTKRKNKEVLRRLEEYLAQCEKNSQEKAATRGETGSYEELTKNSSQSISVKKMNKIEDLIKEAEGKESFSEMVFRFIDEKGLNDSEVYKKAQLDRKLFSKIRNNKAYSPKKETVMAIGIALELSLSQMEELMSLAGYAFLKSNNRDRIVQFFVEEKIYDVQQLNEILYQKGEKTLNDHHA